MTHCPHSNLTDCLPAHTQQPSHGEGNFLTLKVLAAHETGVHVDPGQGHAAQLLKVKVQHVAVDGVEVRTEAGLLL